MAMRDWVWKAIDAFVVPETSGKQLQHDAQTIKYLDGVVISTDPPYYDNIAYADLSDFFFSWAKPAIGSVFPDVFGTLATPKSEELIAAPNRHEKKEEAEKFFLEGMRQAISNMVWQSSDEYPTTIYYAFKQSEIEDEGTSSTGWAIFLQAVLEAGYAIVGTWPIRTELANRIRGIDSNALANSVVLVCRKKEKAAVTITRADFVKYLKRDLPAAIANLKAANIAPADMPQSCIGPGMGIFSRCKAVLEPDDTRMTVKSALQLINAELDVFLNDLHGDMDPETRFAADWFKLHGYENGDFGDADNIARPRETSVDAVKDARIVESAAGKVRICRRKELDADWDPLDDDHLTVWNCCQQLIRTLEIEGEFAAAMLLKKIGPGREELVKDLAYHLFDLCANKRQDAKEANSYNGLIAVWTELTLQAAAISDIDMNRQSKLDI